MPADSEVNRAWHSDIEEWARQHNAVKQRGFYVDVTEHGEVLTPDGASDEESLREVIGHVHQIGWQIRLGEHIEAKGQAEMPHDGALNNESHRLRLPGPGSAPSPNLGRPGYEAETRELLRLAQEAGVTFADGEPDEPHEGD